MTPERREWSDQPQAEPVGRISRWRSSDEGSVILHVTQPGTEGVANYVSTLGPALASRGYRIVVAGPPDTPLQRSLQRAGIGFMPWISSRHPSNRLLADVRHLRRLTEIVRPDVVHLHSSKAGVAGRLALRRSIPTVFQPHAWSFEAVRGPVVAAATRWERYASRWTDVLITVSRGEQEIGEARGIGAASVEIIPNPVDTTVFRPRGFGDAPPAVPGVAAGGGPVALCVGRLCRQKGQDDLLRAWDLVRARVPDARLVLAGSGPLESKIRAEADDSVILLGNRSDTVELFRRADLAVLPSRWEGMSLAMLEAMASGIPVVATDVGGVSETVGCGAGAVVPVGDHRRLADAISSRLVDSELRDREGRVGRQVVLTNHTVGANAEHVCRLYRSLMADSAPDESSSRMRRAVS